MSDFTLPPPALAHLCNLAVEVGVPVDAGHSPLGQRRLVPILGGTVAGRLSGKVLPGGADFQMIHGGTQARLEARYMLELDDGTKIFVQNNALRAASAEVTGRLLRGEPVDPADVYFRCLPRFETSAASLAWIAERVFVGVGVRRPSVVEMRFFEVC